jgi:hypothetical protein
VLPSAIVLDGPHAAQQVMLVNLAPGEDAVTADESAKATWRLENPNVAAVDSRGRVTPRMDGETAIVARLPDGREARVVVRVKNAQSQEPWSFSNQVQPVLTRLGCNSGACHGAAAGKNGLRLSLRAYAPEVDYDVLTRQSLGRRIDTTAPAESLFLLKPTGSLEHGGGMRLDPASLEYRVLSEWIASGMPRPREDEPVLKSVTAVPSRALLAPGSELSVLVQATYSDGRVADVTRWAKFESTDASVLKVNEAGRLRVEGRGEAAVSVWFSNLVDRTTVSVPEQTRPDPSVFARASSVNRIDELNLAKLESLGIPPSPPADDETFLRRAYLDATGVLPPREVVTRYAADPDPEKRKRLFETLLESPEYVDLWAYKWSDLFLVSTRKLASPAMWAFYRFVREQVAQNVPWDDLSRRILLARGSSLTEGGTNYFVLHKDPIDLAESTSVAFLGISLTCARCHNHPLEKWTQDQYYEYANLFARVKQKDGATAGEVIVAPAAEGEVIHPRRGIPLAPRPLEGEPISLESRADRRDAFVSWLTSPENENFDRAIVNRVWRQFLGRGLIEPVDDLRATNPASDPALLDWLVADFRAHKRDLKHLIRTIMSSAVYARSADPVPGNEGDVKFSSHYVVKRLPAEVLMDAYSRVTEVPTSFAGYPAGYRSLQLPDSRVESRFLDAFGRPERASVCSCERSADPSVAQALHLANGDTLNQKLKSDAGIAARLVREKADDAQVIETLFLTALARLPREHERTSLAEVLAEAPIPTGDDAAAAAARRAVIEDAYWSVLASKEFVFNH